MKYITEAQLRDLYKKSPFTSYKCSDDSRLTPNARQFLIDFKIEILDLDLIEKTRKIYKEKKAPIKTFKPKPDPTYRIGILLRKLSCRLRLYDLLISLKLFDLSKDLKISKLKELEILEGAKKLAEEIFMNMEISNPYLDLFVIIDDFAGEINKLSLNEEEKKIVEALVAYTYSLFIKSVKGVNDN
ncbi:hypothetical protein [uncultured Anaerococcus sp.]|uniref:hypothetical protein n=1 Tax=uncultured Anaerococcus sp. TaxID=293428 RepID=UPI00288A0A92|nr:hypothetical protein [uncultured Anaerococcus sp.]